MAAQPQPSTRPLLRLMLAATGSDRPGPKRTGVRRLVAMPGALVAAFPWASLIGAIPGVVLAILGVISGGWSGWLLAAAGIVLLLVGWVVAVAVRLTRKLTVDLPAKGVRLSRPSLSADSDRS